MSSIYENVQNFVANLALQLNEDLPTLVETYISDKFPTDDDTGEICQAGGVNKRPCIIKITGEGSEEEGIYIWNPDTQGYEYFAPSLDSDNKIPYKYLPEDTLGNVFVFDTTKTGETVLEDAVDYLKGLKDPTPNKGDVVIINATNDTNYNGSYLITSSTITVDCLDKITYNTANEDSSGNVVAGIVYTKLADNCLTTKDGLITLVAGDGLKVGGSLSLSLDDESALSITDGKLTISLSTGLYVSGGNLTLTTASKSVLGGVMLSQGVSESDTNIPTGSQVAEYVSEQIKDLATTSYVDEQIEANKPDLSPYAKTEDVESDIATAKKEAISEAVAEANEYTDSKIGGLSFWTGTQSDYDDIPEKDPNTLYIITG